MIPASTYRLQLHAGFGFDDAAALVPYLRDLGVGWVYLSPILESDSDHGYDVVDATRIDAARGGAEGFARLADAAHAAGLGVLVDIVPNHMGVGDARRNAWWWELLKGGRASRAARVFDVDWDAGGGRILLPILGAELDEVLARGEITVGPGAPGDARGAGGPGAREEIRTGEDHTAQIDPPERISPPEGDAAPGVARYFDHVLPLAEGTAPEAETSDPEVVRAVLARQHWTLIFWRRGDAELNYRRFFTVTSLAGVRVEDPEVFDLTHAEILRWFREGRADGLRVDHPDGLADPGAYVARLARELADAAPSRPLSEAAAGGEVETSAPSDGVSTRGSAARSTTGGPYIVIEPFDTPAAPATQEPAGVGGDAAYLVIEKILEPGEELPSAWASAIAGTTGYDALAEIDRVLVDPAGEAELDAIDAGLRAESGLPPLETYGDMVHAAKRDIADTSLLAEVRRLAREAPASVVDIARAHTHDALEDALAELLAAFPTYRAYLPDGDEWLQHAADEAARRRPERAPIIAALAAALRADPHGTFTLRFMQTAGPVMAKGVEDRTFYRYSRLSSLTEVGGDPSLFALDPDAFHAAFARRQERWPHAMTTLSTHDTKRSEDVRARLAVLAEIPERWAEVLGRLRVIASTDDGAFDNLLWQAIVGAWPASPDRLQAYAIKAAREAALHTTWTDPHPRFEERVANLVRAAHGRAISEVNAFVDEIREPGRANALSAKLLQLAGPGVPDVYQGSELWDLSLVDPDNRRPVDFAERWQLLVDLDEGRMPELADPGTAKLLVVSRTLRLRRDRPELFEGYTPLRGEGPAADHLVAFDRGGAITVATRLPVGRERAGGWRDTTLALPAGSWRDELTGRSFPGGAVRVAELLCDHPVALLARAD